MKPWTFNSRFLFLARHEIPFSSDLCCLHCHDPSLGCYCQAKSFPCWSPEIWMAAGHCCNEHQQVKRGTAPEPNMYACCRETLCSFRKPSKVKLEETAEGYLSSGSQPLVGPPTGCKIADKEPPNDWKKQVIILCLTCTSLRRVCKPGNQKERWWPSQIVRLQPHFYPAVKTEDCWM